VYLSNIKCWKTIITPFCGVVYLKVGNWTQLKKGSDAGTVPPKVERLTSALDESDEGSSKRKGSPKANYVN